MMMLRPWLTPIITSLLNIFERDCQKGSKEPQSQYSRLGGNPSLNYYIKHITTY